MTSFAKVKSRRVGRPPSENPMIDRRVTRFTEVEGRRLNAYMHRKGIAGDAELIRELIIGLLDSENIEDPGQDSPLAVPPVSRQRKKPDTSAPRQRRKTEQLELAS